MSGCEMCFSPFIHANLNAADKKSGIKSLSEIIRQQSSLLRQGQRFSEEDELTTCLLCSGFTLLRERKKKMKKEMKRVALIKLYDFFPLYPKLRLCIFLSRLELEIRGPGE